MQDIRFPMRKKKNTKQVAVKTPKTLLTETH